MEFVSFVGQTLDDKYKIEREIGRGGMGTVYLATHVGTERPVALKIIAPQFMQRVEFVERFRREARAAGRLRHPNVVDVTDFGFAETAKGNVAYLVMEYLDGVTLGEVLEEEKKLPLSWTLDILEQVCSAVQEAHAQGIIHRDLKPDNIWLEPNQRGGYTVKVLDFGIAKLENLSDIIPGSADLNLPVSLTSNLKNTTFADSVQPQTIVENKSLTVNSEAGTLLQTEEFNASATEAGTLLQTDGNNLEDQTAIFDSNENKTISIEETFRTKLNSAQIETGKSLINTPDTKNLTRVGAVLGTPLYMSPEQCRGERLSQSSDIYSLGIIAYQMLSGDTPFTGDFKTVMQAHKEIEPPQLDVKNVPKRLKRTIMESLAKEAEKRPQTAEMFASRLRANSEGLGELIRRALVIYSQHLPKFLLLALVTGLPYILMTVLKVSYKFLEIGKVVNEEGSASWLIDSFFGLTTFFIQIFYAAFLVGMTTWIVAQILAVPLRPISLRAAFNKSKSRWKPLMGTVTFSTLLAMIAWIIGFFVGGAVALAVGVPLYFYVSQIMAFVVGSIITIVIGVGFAVYTSGIFMLVAPSIMMEDLRGRKAFRRSINLEKRSRRTVFAASFIVYFIPVVLAFVIAFSISAIVKSVITEINEPKKASTSKNNGGFNVNFGSEGDGNVTTSDDKNASKEQAEAEHGKTLEKLAPAISQQIIELLLLPVLILMASFTSVVTALLYFKTRQAGGETMQDLLEQFEESDRPKSNWQKRVRQRLVQSGRVTSRSSGTKSSNRE